MLFTQISFRLTEFVNRFKVIIMDWQKIIIFNPEIRFGKPCIRGTRMAVIDVLEYLASGMSFEEIIDDFPELSKEDILACLKYAAFREQRVLVA